MFQSETEYKKCILTKENQNIHCLDPFMHIWIQMYILK